MYGFYREEEEYSELATPREACREYARNVGRDCPDVAWISTDWDSWEPNPFYCGPAVPHPEDACYMDFDDPELENLK